MKALFARKALLGREALTLLTFLCLFTSSLWAQEPETRARRVGRERKVVSTKPKPKAKPKVVTVADNKEAKERLTTLGYWLTKTDESYRHALIAFQKVQALTPTGKLSLEDLEVLRAARTPVPKEVQQLADRCYALLRENPQHPSLHFKKVGPYRSVRVGIAYRALGVEDSESIVWFWIGSHVEYERLINR